MWSITLASFESHQQNTRCRQQIYCNTNATTLDKPIMAPRASGRTSAKSKISTGQASSPPRVQRVQASESPLARQTRSSSRGIEDHHNAPSSRTKRGKTASREGSVESVGSTRSNASNRGRKQAAARKPATRGTSFVYNVLPHR